MLLCESFSRLAIKWPFNKVGMVVSVEVNLGSRTVMEYLLSPIQKDQ
jgi:hypothetical protein